MPTLYHDAPPAACDGENMYMRPKSRDWSMNSLLASLISLSGTLTKRASTRVNVADTVTRVCVARCSELRNFTSCCGV